MEACTELEVVDSVEVESTESFTVSISLREPNPAIAISQTMSTGVIEIIDDDSKAITNRSYHYGCYSFIAHPVGAVVGLNITSYSFSRASDSLQVSVYVSQPTPDQTSCPITFTFDIVFHLAIDTSGNYNKTYCSNVHTVSLHIRNI